MLDMRSLSFITPEGGLAPHCLPLTTETEAGRASIAAMAGEYVAAAQGTGGGALFDVTLILFVQDREAGMAFSDAVEGAVFC